MTKKIKLILGAASLTSVIAIVPAAVISCSSESNNTNDKATVDNNAKMLTNLNISAIANTNISALDAAKLLTSGSDNLNSLSKYFDTKTIENVATANGVSATYSASVVSNNLVISVSLSLGSNNSTQTLNITGFPTPNQISNLSTLASLGTSLSALKLSALNNQVSLQTAYNALKMITTPLTTTNLGVYFNTSSISNAINAISTTSNPITVTYAINNLSDYNLANGSINITTTLSLGSGTSLATQTANLIVDGFLTASQVVMNTYINSFISNSNIKAISTVLPSSIPSTGISIADISQYVTGVLTPPTGVTTTFNVITNANSDLSGTISLSVTLTSTNNSVSTSVTSPSISISGFITSTEMLDTVVGTMSSTYNVLPIQTNVTSSTAYNSLKALEVAGTLNIDSFSTYFDTSSLITEFAKLNNLVTVINVNPIVVNNIKQGSLVITFNFSFNGATKTVKSNILGFEKVTPSSAQETSYNNLESVATKLSELSIVTTTKTTETSQAIYTQILAIPNLTLNELDAYFPIDAINAAIAATSGVTSSALAIIKPNIENITNGSISFSLTLSLGTGADLVTLPANFTVSGFFTNQKAVNNYIASINTLTGDNVIKAKSATTSLPTTLTNNNFDQYLANVPAIPTGVTLTFALSSPNPADGTINIIITASAENASSLATSTIIVSGFISTNQTAVENYIASINALTGDNVIKAKSATTSLPTALTNLDYSTYLANVPTIPVGSGITLSFVLADSSSTAGTINITITASLGSSSLAAKTITVAGFLTTNQAAINNYINTFQSSTTIIGINTVLPSSITSTSNISMTDITKYFSGIVTPASGITATFNITTSSDSDSNGQVGLTVTLSGENATPVTSNIIIVNGFLTNSQVAINTYVKNFKAATITGKNIYLPSLVPTTINATNIGNYFDGVTSTTGLNATFSVSLPTNANIYGIISLTVTLVSANATSTTSTVTISGLQTSQMALDSLDTSILKTYASVGQSAIVPTTAYNALTTIETSSALTLNDFSTYFDIKPINTAITTAGVSVSSISLNPISTTDLVDGTLTFNLNLSLNGLNQTILITLTGFHATPLIPGQGDNLTKLKTIEADLQSATTVTTQTNITALSAYNAINLISPLPTTIDGLSSYFDTSAIKAIITKVAGTTSILNVKTSTYNNTLGTITFSLTLSLGTGSDEASINTTFILSGFQIPPVFSLNLTLATNTIYPNYWAGTADTTLGNSPKNNSLYITGATDPFNSQNALEKSGKTTLPTFITNNDGFIWPSGFTDASLVSWTETGDNTTGVATYTLELSTINKITNKTETVQAIITISGFMTIANISTLSGMGVNTASNIGTIATPVNGPVVNSTPGFSAVGISGVNWNNLNMSLFGGGVSYSIANANPTTGTANWLFTFTNGVILSVPVTGYLVTKQVEPTVPTAANTLVIDIKS